MPPYVRIDMQLPIYNFEVVCCVHNISICYNRLNHLTTSTNCIFNLLSVTIHVLVHRSDTIFHYPMLKYLSVLPLPILRYHPAV